MTYSIAKISHFAGQRASPLFCFTIVVHAAQPINDNVQFHFSFVTVQIKINLVKLRLKICFLSTDMHQCIHLALCFQSLE